MRSYVSPKQSAYCPECFHWSQQERTANRGERLCASGHVFTLKQSREALAKDYPELKDPARKGKERSCDLHCELAVHSSRRGIYVVGDVYRAQGVHAMTSVK
jgi:hypothetical protein